MVGAGGLKKEKAPMNDVSEPKQISPETARAALEQERTGRTEACRRELAEVLQKHRCQIDASAVLRNGTVSFAIAVMALD